MTEEGDVTKTASPSSSESNRKVEPSTPYQFLLGTSQKEKVMVTNHQKGKKKKRRARLKSENAGILTDRYYEYSVTTLSGPFDRWDPPARGTSSGADTAFGGNRGSW